MFTVALIAVLISLVLAMVRAIIGPTMFDRVLAVNSTATLAVLSLALIGFVAGRPEFLDIAILYTLFDYNAINKNRKAWIYLLIDVIIGLISFLVYHSMERNLSKVFP